MNFGFRSTFIAGLTLVASALTPAYAQDAAAIMDKANAVMGHFETAVAEVNLVTGKGNKKRQRLLRLVSKQDGGVRQLIATFRGPAAVKGVGFTTIHDVNEGTRQSWVYLPSIGNVRELKGSQQHESFFGSDFSYSDLMGRDAAEDTHELVSEDSSHYIIDSTPKNKNDVYGKLKYKIGKQDMSIREVTFYNRNGAQLKRLTNTEFEDVDNVPVVLTSTMKNLKTGSVTLLERTSMQVGVALYDDDFGPEALQ